MELWYPAIKTLILFPEVTAANQLSTISLKGMYSSLANSQLAYKLGTD